MVFKLSMIAVKLVQQAVLVNTLPSYLAAPGVAVYSMI
jgi:hypothetical protein